MSSNTRILFFGPINKNFFVSVTAFVQMVSTQLFWCRYYDIYWILKTLLILVHNLPFLFRYIIVPTWDIISSLDPIASIQTTYLSDLHSTVSIVSRCCHTVTETNMYFCYNLTVIQLLVSIFLVINVASEMTKGNYNQFYWVIKCTLYLNITYHNTPCITQYNIICAICIGHFNNTF